jgi:DNA-binding transcriptional ArsR family regulator
MGQAADTGKKRTAQSGNLGALVAHPTRSRCLTLLADREASPNEIALEIGEPVANVAYHVRSLLKAGVIELVRERPVRGATEHFYRATVRPYLSDEETTTMALADRQAHAREMLSLTAANANSALAAGTMCERAGYHVCRTPLRLDQEAWEELGEVYDEALERAFQIQSRAAERCGEEGDASFPVIAFHGFFEMPERRESA